MKTTLNRSSLSILFYLGLALCLSFGQDQDSDPAKPAPPQPPYVGTLSGDFVFVKKFIYKVVQPDPHENQERKDFLNFYHSRFSPPTEVDATETGTLRVDKNTFTNGLTIETWRAGNYRLQVYSTSPQSISVFAAMQGVYQDAPDFAELGWITGASYQGEQTLQGKKCYVYTLDDQTAWIEKVNRMPVQLDSKSMQVTYSYKEPDAPLQLPDKFAKRLQEVVRPPADRSN